MKKDIAALREEYRSSGLKRSDLALDPFDQFERWLHEAIGAELVEPNAFSLATVDFKGSPSLRTLLLKKISKEGLSFFTNTESPKALDIENNPNVAMLFPWLGLERQVEVLGVATKLDEEESLKYFKSRPLGAQLGAWASKQSAPIESRKVIEDSFQVVKDKFGGKEIPLPPFWGGYRVEPYLFEFWQGRADRLHDRLQYQLVDGQWIIERLSP